MKPFLPLFAVLSSLSVSSAAAGEVFFSVSRSAAGALPPVEARSLAADEKLGAAPDTLQSVLETALPVLLRRSDGRYGPASVSMRGFQSNQTAVFLDDVRLPADLTGGVDLSLIPAAALGRIEVLPGAASAAYGANSAGGAVQLFTRRLSPGARLANAEASYGSYSTRSADLKAGAGFRGMSVFAGGASDATAGFQQNSRLNRDSASARLTADLGAAGSADLTALFSRQHNGLPSGTPVPIADWNGRRERRANSLTDWLTSRREFTSLSWNFGPENWKFTVVPAVSVNDKQAYQFGSADHIRITDRSVAGRLAAPGGMNAGAERTVSALRSTLYGDHAVGYNSAWAQKVFAPAAGLELTTGLRADKYGEFRARTSPKLAAVYAPDEKWKFSASAGRGFRVPTFADLYNPWAAPAPGLKPETSSNVQAGARYCSPGGWYAGLSAYYSDIKDRIALDPVTWGAANLEAGFNRGLEAEAGLIAGKLDLSGGYARNASMVKQGGTYKLQNFNPEQRFTGLAKWRGEGYTLAADLAGATAEYTGRGSTGLRLPERWVFGLNGSLSLGGAELTAGLANIFDRRYAGTADSINGWFPQPGRTFTVGVRAKFA